MPAQCKPIMQAGRLSRVRLILIGTTVLFVGLASCLVTPVARGERSASPKRILALYWSGKDYPGNVVFDQYFQATLKSSSDWIEYYPEYLDSYHFPGEAQSGFLRDYLRQKYAGHDINVVLALADTPLNFLLKYRAELFPTAPIVFIANSPPTVEQRAAGPGLTGFVNNNPYIETLDLALRMHPDTEQVFIVSGTLTHNKRFENACRRELVDYEGRVTINYLTDLSPDDLTAKVKSVPERSIIFYIWQQAKNEQGRLLQTQDVIALVANSASVPIYGVASWQVGKGIVGGYLRDMETNGARAADVALRIANGELAQNIPIESIPVKPMFDWRELTRWEISETSLPPGSVVRFRMPSFWDENKWYAIAVISVVIVQSILIAGLVINRSRRKRAEIERECFASLAESGRRRLDEVLSNVPGVVWESHLQPDGATRQAVFVNQYAEKLLGYSVQEWLATLNFSQVIAHVEDRERIGRVIESVANSGKEGQIQFRWLTKDGRQLWVEAHLAVIRNEAGKVVGVRGITLDITERKLVDESLQRSEERNRAILRAIPDLMFLQTIDGTYLDYQAKEKRDLLVPPEEFLGKNMRDVLPSELAESLLASFHRAQETEEPQSVEYALRLAGVERWFEARIVTTQGDKILSVVRDITDRKRAEAALVDNQAQLAGIVGSAMDAILSIDQNQRIVLFNGAAEKMFRCDARHAIGQTLDRFLPERYRQRHSEHIRHFGESNATKRLMALGSMYGRRVNGEEFPIEASISQLELHGQKYYTVILRDITERRQAMEALRESEERFRTMADTAPVMIWVSDIDKERIYFNERWLAFTGRALEQELRDGWADGVYPDDIKACVETYYASFDRREPFTMEYRLRRSDGQNRWVLDSGTPRFSPSGQFLGYIGSCIDITERKAAHEALQDLSGQLIRARENECARIARELHDDLNQRMALVSVELERLAQDPPDAHEELRNNLQQIIGQTTEISGEIHRMSYDLHPSKLVHLGLVAAVKSLCDELRASHGLKTGFTHSDVPTNLPQDLSLCLYRIVQECLTNVIRHSGAPEAQVEIVGTKEEIRLRVSDSGRGFDIESPRIKKGLGLVSMRERLRLVGGRISIESSPTGGTQIDARVPQGQTDSDYQSQFTDRNTKAAAP